MALDLRPYQQDLVQRVRDTLRTSRRVVAQLPTGAGKTRVAGALAHSAQERGNLGWFTVHRRELALQALERMRELGVHATTFMAGMRHDPSAALHIVSVDTFNARVRLGKPLPPRPAFVIDDECHHAPAMKYEPMFRYTESAHRVGLTATPWRLDGTGLKARYDELVIGPKPQDLVEAGYLVPFEMWAGPPPDLVGVPTRAGDFARGELAKRAAAVVGDVVSTYARVCAHARAICFAVNRAHSEQLADEFSAAGFPAWHIDFKTPEAERRAAIEAFAAGNIKVLCNVEIVTEGFDVPACEAAILARPTQSESLYLQMAGRAGRPHDGKTKGYLIDHGNNVFRFGDPWRSRALSLEGRQIKVPKPGEERDDAQPDIRLCEKCLHVYKKGVGECPHCGHVYVPPPPKTDKKTQLRKVDKETLSYAQRAMRRARLRQLEEQADKLKKNPWVASYWYKNEFGRMPHEDDVFFSSQERGRYWARRRKRG